MPQRPLSDRGVRMIGATALCAVLGATLCTTIGAERRAAAADAAPQPPADPAARASGTVGTRARLAAAVVAPHGATTDIALSNPTWTQPADEFELLAGTVTVRPSSACTGAFVNALSLSVDGRDTTFAAPPVPAAGTAPAPITVPFLVGTLTEPGQSTPHTLTAKFRNACTQAGEDYTVQDVKVDVLSFR